MCLPRYSVSFLRLSSRQRALRSDFAHADRNLGRAQVRNRGLIQQRIEGHGRSDLSGAGDGSGQDRRAPGGQRLAQCGDRLLDAVEEMAGAELARDAELQEGRPGAHRFQARDGEADTLLAAGVARDRSAPGQQCSRWRRWHWPPAREWRGGGSRSAPASPGGNCWHWRRAAALGSRRRARPASARPSGPSPAATRSWCSSILPNSIGRLRVRHPDAVAAARCRCRWRRRPRSAGR